MSGKPLLLAFLMAGCATAPKLLPRNEINDPVFHKTDFIALGAVGGNSWTRREGGDAFRDDIYLVPDLAFETHVNSWASYGLLPVFWNLLLTGEQYSDGAHLKIRKLNIAFHGGITGVAYSSRSGWETGALLALDGKYLITRNWFLGAELKAEWEDLAEWDSRIDRISIGVGAQVTERNSLKLTYALNRFDLPWDEAYNYRGIFHLDGDTRTKVELRHTYYAWRNHVLGPELGFAYRNTSVSKTLQIAVGAHYAYMFD